MVTLTGKWIFPPDSEHHDEKAAPDIADIAIGLSRMPRFAGQTQHYYSVLCHTITVGSLVDDSHRAHALLHDAPEAIVCDVPTPWKTERTMADELRLLELISGEFGLAWPWPEETLKAIKLADEAALAAEAHALGHVEAERFWPRAEFDEMAEAAWNITMRHLAEGWTMRFLTDRQAALNTFGQNLMQSLPGRKAAETLLRGGARVQGQAGPS